MLPLTLHRRGAKSAAWRVLVNGAIVVVDEVERLSLTAQGQVRYCLKTAYRDGTTHMVLEPVDFIARLAALVPPPRQTLTRFHGVFAPHAALRAAITPAGRGSGGASTIDAVLVDGIR